MSLWECIKGIREAVSEARLTNKIVFDGGNEVDSWACDVSFTDAAGEEHIIEYQGKYYSVVTHTEDDSIVKPNAIAIEVDYDIESGSLRNEDEAVSTGLKKWRKHQKPGAVMKPSIFKKIEKSAAASGATDPAKVAGAAYWKTAKAKYHKAKEAVGGEWAEEEEKLEQKSEMEWEDYLWKEDVRTLKGILDDILHGSKFEASPRQLEILRTVIRRKELGERKVEEKTINEAEIVLDTEVIQVVRVDTHADAVEYGQDTLWEISDADDSRVFDEKNNNKLLAIYIVTKKENGEKMVVEVNWNRKKRFFNAEDSEVSKEEFEAWSGLPVVIRPTGESVNEQGPATAEPTTEPGIETTPTTTPEKPRHPLAPKPGVHPKPKAELTPEQEQDLALFLKARGKA